MLKFSGSFKKMMALSLLLCALLVSKKAHAQDDSYDPPDAQGPPDEDAIDGTDTPFPFFSHFMFGAGSGAMPMASADSKTTNQSLYMLSLGIDVPFFIAVDYAMAVGVRMSIQYPTYLNIKDGEPTYHLAAAPNVEVYRNIVRNTSWYVDLLGGLTWIFRRSQYAVGTLASNGPELMVGTKVRWLPYTILNSTPIFNLRGQVFGPLNSYKM